MKKTFLLLLILTVFSVSASAQATRYTSVIAKDTLFNIDNNNPCPVVSIDNWYSLAAVKVSATTTAFCLIDHSYFTNTPLPVTPVIPPAITAYAAVLNYSANDFTVNDMTVDDNMAFFCGTIDGATAFYGYFNVGDYDAMHGGGGIMGSSVNIYIYCLGASGATTAPVTLNKLVAYIHNSKSKVVAIGNDEISPYKGVSKIVEIRDATGTPSCEVADMPHFLVSGKMQKIVLDDIVLTNKYVAVLGHDAGALSNCDTLSGLRYPWLSVGGRGDVVAEICDPILNPNYYLPHSLEAIEEVIGVALKDDTIGMTYVYPGVAPDANIYSRFRTIILPSVKNTHSQQFIKDSKDNPVEMAYSNIIKKVELLQPMAHSSDYVLLNPYATTNYTTTVLNPNDHIFKSLCYDIFSTGIFISARNAEVYIEDRTANIPFSASSCPSNYSLLVEIIDDVQFKQSACDIIHGTNELINPQNSQISIIPTPLRTQCFSYE